MPPMPNPIDREELENRFGFHPATDKTRELHQQVREGFIEFSERLLEFIPDGREKSLVVTALEEASMWANAAIARNLAPLKYPEEQEETAKEVGGMAAMPMPGDYRKEQALQLAIQHFGISDKKKSVVDLADEFYKYMVGNNS